jgi:hypothetical protein
VMLLPEAATPGASEPNAAVRRRAHLLAKVLDDWLNAHQQSRGCARSNPEIALGEKSGLQQPQPRDCGSDSSGSAGSVHERGVGGRIPPSVIQSEAQLPPAVTRNDEGVGADAPGKRTRRGVETATLTEPREDFEVRRARFLDGLKSLGKDGAA